MSTPTSPSPSPSTSPASTTPATDAATRLAALLDGARVQYLSADPGIGIYGTKGASVHVQEVVRAMRTAGADVRILAAKIDGEAPADLADVPVHALASRPRVAAAEREAWLLAQDSEIAAALDPTGTDLTGTDLVYERYSLFSAAALERARAAGVATVLEVNAPLIDEHAAHRGLVHEAEAREVMRRAVTAADVVTCVSEPVARWVAAQVPGARTVVAPNGVNTDRIRPRPERSEGPVTLGFVGTLKPWHGVEILLEAAAPLVRDGVARLLLVGDGPQAAALGERAAALGIADGVERTGALDPRDVPAHLHRMDVGVAPYPAGADDYFSPLKVYEYLAAGLPVVASAVGQIPDVVRDGLTGVLVPPSDVEALRDALALLCEHAPTRERMGRAARADAVELHGWDRTVATSLGALPLGRPLGRPTAVTA
ncbi:glycosyltransferase family 1 protein [Serinibacter arcticus]|uniref:Glycosyltransferase family 1 protein n=1 Tax=Serinibacter arcticus TaxID=1655435 RepID=A0A2U1ZX12_9MICO|nr:glycosyltransferase family 4 protein [Serinibacter arcticus]PWD51527.1 glycosyltransferase family 1 protein [Serinibacter arcticus]